MGVPSRDRGPALAFTAQLGIIGYITATLIGDRHMPVESWTRPDDIPTLAAEATAQIDAVLGRLDVVEREAFWSSIRKCYNTPYNDPAPRKLVRLDQPVAAERRAEPAPRAVAAAMPPVDLAALAAIPHAAMVEVHAG